MPSIFIWLVRFGKYAAYNLTTAEITKVSYIGVGCRGRGRALSSALGENDLSVEDIFFKNHTDS